MSRMRESDAMRVENAIELAMKFHRGQRDKAGAPYLLHVLTTMIQSNDPVVQQAAVLHDLIEDTSATREDLAQAGIDSRAIEAVELLTHDPNLTYADYIIKLKSNDVARQVKLLDIQDNYRLNRVAFRADHLDEDGKRIQRYILTKAYLSDEIDQQTYLSCMAQFEVS